MKTAILFTTGGGLFLLLLGLIIYFPQRHFVFSPRYYPNRDLFEKQRDYYHLQWLAVETDVDLEGIIYEPENATSTVIYFGGKGQDSVGLIHKWSLEFPTVRWISFNYRGYGKSQGKATEARILQDNIRVYDWAQSRYNEIGLMGFSLGSSIASYVASQRNPAWVVLVGPFYSVIALIRAKVPFIPDFLIKYRFETARFVNGVNCPVHIFNSREDEIVPASHVSRLRTQVKHLAGTHEFTGFSHDSLLFSDALKPELEKILYGEGSHQNRA